MTDYFVASNEVVLERSDPSASIVSNSVLSTQSFSLGLKRQRSSNGLVVFELIIQRSDPQALATVFVVSFLHGNGETLLEGSFVQGTVKTGEVNRDAARVSKHYAEER